METTVAKYANVREWLDKAHPGASMTYATGDRLPAFPTLAMSEIRHAYNNGRVDLVQKRRGKLETGFEYIVQMRRRVAVIHEHGRFQREHIHLPKKDAA